MAEFRFLRDTEVESLTADDVVFTMERGKHVGPFYVVAPVGIGTRSDEHIHLLNRHNNVHFEAYAFSGNLYVITKYIGEDAVLQDIEFN